MADVMQPPKGGEPDTPEQKKPVPLVNDGLSPSDVDFIPPLVHFFGVPPQGTGS